MFCISLWCDSRKDAFLALSCSALSISNEWSLTFFYYQNFYIFLDLIDVNLFPDHVFGFTLVHFYWFLLLLELDLKQKDLVFHQFNVILHSLELLSLFRRWAGDWLREWGLLILLKLGFLCFWLFSYYRVIFLLFLRVECYSKLLLGWFCLHSTSNKINIVAKIKGNNFNVRS